MERRCKALLSELRGHRLGVWLERKLVRVAYESYMAGAHEEMGRTEGLVVYHGAKISFEFNREEGPIGTERRFLACCRRRM